MKLSMLAKVRLSPTLAAALDSSPYTAELEPPAEAAQRESFIRTFEPTLEVVPTEFLDRIECALKRHISGGSARRLPVDPCDSDVVLAELEQLRGKQRTKWNERYLLAREVRPANVRVREERHV